MIILFHDLVQDADAPAHLRSPALSETWGGTAITIYLRQSHTFDAVGIGNTDATEITVAGRRIAITDPSPYPASYKNGLYRIPETTGQRVAITHNGSYIGRLALGMGRILGCAPAREPGFETTATNRETLSGQVIPGAGGYQRRRIDVDFRYKINQAIFRDIEQAYSQQLSRGFPLFILFDQEAHRIPWTRLYAQTDHQLLFQSSANSFRYSRRFVFRECF